LRTLPADSRAGESALCCFPAKIERASAGWTRAVAIIED
jgi:hypothetical protein